MPRKTPRNGKSDSAIPRETRDAARKPGSFPRRILLAVSGDSPQIVTETIYALALNPDPEIGSFIPNEIHLVTTSKGARTAHELLIAEPSAWLARLYKEYHLGPVQFGRKQIHVIRGSDGEALEDIRTHSDNHHSENTVLDLMRKLTQSTETAVHGTIAGGRKSMGFYLGSAFSIFGRPQDRLSHVLIAPSFLESRRYFFYPPRNSRMATASDLTGEAFDLSKAEITLANLPFVRLRTRLTPAELRAPSGLAQLIEVTQTSIDPPRLVIDLHDKCVHAGSVRIRLQPELLSMYSWFARRCIKRSDPVTCPSAKDEDDPRSIEYGREISREYQLINPDRHRPVARISASEFSQKITKIRSELSKALGARAEPYLVLGQPIGKHRHFALRLEPDQIAYASGEARHSQE